MLVPMLIDTHCHLDAFEFDTDRAGIIERARAAGVGAIVLPAVDRAGFGRVRAVCAGQPDLRFALGIHPLYLPAAQLSDIDALAFELDDPDVIAVGEIGLDFFVAHIDPTLQEDYFVRQLGLARDVGLPVLLHVRRSQDRILKHLRAVFGRTGPGGIAHAFNGSRQQADQLLEMGFKLGFGGAVTYERATRLRAMAAQLPPQAIVMETDAPDIAPQWLYAPAAQRAAGGVIGRNEPGELPRVAATLAALRGAPLDEWAAQTTANALAALPRLAAL